MASSEFPPLSDYFLENSLPSIAPDTAGKAKQLWFLQSISMAEPQDNTPLETVLDGEECCAGKENAGVMESWKMVTKTKKKKKKKKMNSPSILHHHSDSTHSSELLPPPMADPKLDLSFLQIRRALQSKPVNFSAADLAAMAKGLVLKEQKQKETQIKPNGPDPSFSNHNSKPAMTSSIHNTNDLAHVTELEHHQAILRQRSLSLSSSGTPLSFFENKIHGNDAENQRRKSTSVLSVPGHVSSGNVNRPPWWSFTTIPDNRARATIAERVMPQAEAVVSQRSAAAMAKTEKQKNKAPNEDSEKEEDQGRELPPSSTQAEARTKEYRSKPVAIGSGHTEKEVILNRNANSNPSPNQPWRLSPSRSITTMSSSSSCCASQLSKPLHMCPSRSPLCKKYSLSSSSSACSFPSRSGHGCTGISSKVNASVPPRLSPFRSFHLQPLKLGDSQPCERRLTPSATIRPYVSPSKNTLHQSVNTAIAPVKLKERPLPMPSSSSSSCCFNTSNIAIMAESHSDYNQKLCRSKRLDSCGYPNSFSPARHCVQRQSPSPPPAVTVQKRSSSSPSSFSVSSSSPSCRIRPESIALELPSVSRLPLPPPSMIPGLPTRNNFKKKKRASSIDSSIHSYNSQSTYSKKNNMTIKLSRSASMTKYGLSIDPKDMVRAKDLAAKREEKEAMKKKLEKTKQKEEMNCEALLAAAGAGGLRRRSGRGRRRRRSSIDSVRPPSLMD